MALTKVSGGILDPGINVAGIVTATGFDGPFTGGSGSNITAGIITCTELDLNGNGNISGNLVIEGNLTANGDFTTLNTTLREVEILRVDADTTAVAGIITQRGSGNILELYDTSTNVLTVADGGTVGIGSATPLSAMALDVVGSIRYSNQLRGAAGSAAEPSYAFYADHDSGMYRGGTNILSFATAGTERLNLDADGVATFSSVVGIHTGVKIQQTGLNWNAGLEINATNGGQARLELKTSKSGTNRASRIDFYNQNSQKWTLINDFNQNGTNDFRITDVNHKIYIKSNLNDSVELYNNGNVKLTTQDSGVFISGALRLQGTEAAYRTGQAQPLIYRSGSTSGTYPFNNFGHLIIQTRIDGSNRDIIFVTGSSAANQIVINSNGDMKIPDGKELQFGGPLDSGDGDLRLYHNATDSYVSNNTGHLRIGNTHDNKNIKFFTNGSTKWDIDSDGHFIPDTAGAVNIGSASVGIGSVFLAEQKELNLEPTGAFKIYRGAGGGGANNFVQSTFGSIFIQAANGVVLKVNNTHDAVAAYSNDRVDIYHANNIKLTTTTTGIDVTGEVAASQDYPNFRPTLDLNFAAEKKLDPKITYQRTGPASFTNEFGKVVLVGDNSPRFDHDPITRESKGLLIEESRTNIFASSDPANSAWLLDGGITKGANTTETTAPDGTFTACKLMSAASANSYSQIYDGLSRSSGGVQSLWAKKGTHNVIGIFDYSGGSGIRGWFDVNTGEHRCEGGSKVAAGVQSNGNDTNNTNMVEYPNGWYRCIYYEAAHMSYAHFRIVDFDSDNEASASSNSIYLWGLQAEDNDVKFATSFIPCDTGVMPGTITRGADIVRIMDDEFKDIFGDEFNEFSLVADYNNDFGVGASGQNYAIFDMWGESAGYNDRIQIFRDDVSPYHIETRAFGQGNALFNNGELTASTLAKTQRFAASWYVPDYSNTSSRRFVISMGGEAVDVIPDNTGTTVPQLTRMGIGCNPTRLDFPPGLLHFKRLMVYNKTLSDNQLQNLSAQ